MREDNIKKGVLRVRDENWERSEVVDEKPLIYMWTAALCDNSSKEGPFACKCYFPLLEVNYIPKIALVSTSLVSPT